ncbi:hypothetical protein C8J31_11676 [Rhizobium sp. PP-CC-2G-626]|nr:hypothetical protein C8J31_11676 [Rhizobium sp. PP-CC-2G-626]
MGSHKEEPGRTQDAEDNFAIALMNSIFEFAWARHSNDRERTIALARISDRVARAWAEFEEMAMSVLEAVARQCDVNLTSEALVPLVLEVRTRGLADSGKSTFVATA